MGNLFFGIIAFIALPLWFYIQRRRRDLSTASKYQPSTPIATVSYITLFLCLICSYVSYNTDKKPTFDKIKEIFPDEVQGSKGFIRKKSQKCKNQEKNNKAPCY